MSDSSLSVWDALLIMFIIVIVWLTILLFHGEPDLMDAFVKMLMNDK